MSLDTNKTYLVWNGAEFPNSTSAFFKAPAGSTIDWGDGTVETFNTASTKVNTHTYTDGKTEHTIAISGLRSIGNSAFYNCSSLTSVTIGNSVTIIVVAAFEYCSNLKSVTIGNSVTSIDNLAFRGCTKLTQLILFPSTPPTLASNAIPDNVQSIYVQQSSKAAYRAATNWKAFASKIVGDNLYLSFIRFNQKNKEYINGKVNELSAAANLENGTGAGSLVQKTVSSSGTPYANEASGSGAVAMGKKVKSKGNATFVTGQENEAIAGTSASFTSGRLNVNRGSYNITGGENNANNNSWNLVIGKNNSVSDGRFGIVSGLDNVFTGLGSDENSAVSILGKNLYVQYSMPSDGALLIGRYNKVQNNPGRLFIVGNGTSPDDRKNAFEVLEDGRAKVYKKPDEVNDVLRWQEKVELETKINTFINSIFTDTNSVRFIESGDFGTGLMFYEAGIYRVKASYTYSSKSGTDILIFSVSVIHNTMRSDEYEIKVLKNGEYVMAASDRQGGGTLTTSAMQWIYLRSGVSGGTYTQVTNWKYEKLNLADLGTIS